MRIASLYSHLNGLEYLLVHKPALWREVENTITNVNALACRTKTSKERGMVGKSLYSPAAMNACFFSLLRAQGWNSETECFYVTGNPVVARETLTLPLNEQKQAILNAGETPYISSKQTDFVKDRVAIEVQFAKYAYVSYDMFIKHMIFFTRGKIDVGIEIVPTKALTNDVQGGRSMSSGVPNYEVELYNLLSQGRSAPAVPIVLIGIAP